ncbi:p35 apoptosis inhibitor [Choristoneura rosaceana entomopoxvirus 'L']|uniref:P35 apoptosis inhibitor n=1 Tax=Choristoneura rosaceana entomopoxvirus 'L' TaxID=1293539 RepID=A0ABM9QKY5_9POXV|nr:p35 apoptosis inhibitor [Choristoneura rosaceana entomopoxvirus 'L']CCU56176.1 p35 apoptosis inhibitor [Choristoneura rosaceana entomopoxvirus 'L']
MCILDPEFFASSTTIIDIRHDDTKRELTYINKLEPLETRLKYTHTKMLFHISGPLIDVKTDNVDTLIDYKNIIDKEFDKYKNHKIVLDCTTKFETTKFETTKFETEAYHVQSFPLSEFEKNYVEILKNMDTSDKDINNFIDITLPAVVDKKSAIPTLDSKDCHVVICILKKSLFDKHQIVKFIYKPIDNKIILPIMCDISPNCEYKYDIRCFMDNVFINDIKIDEIRNFMSNIKFSNRCINVKEIHSTKYNYNRSYSLCYLKHERNKNITDVCGFIYDNNNIYVKLCENTISKLNTNIVFDIMPFDKNEFEF